MSRNRSVVDPDQIEAERWIISQFERGHETLSAEEQARLHALALQGDEQARLRLFLAWRRFAFVVARQFSHLAPIEDLYQEAQVALWNAILTWRPGAGRSLGGWALLPMWSACRNALGAYRPGVRLPSYRDQVADLPETVSIDQLNVDLLQVEAPDAPRQYDMTDQILRTIREVCSPREAEILELLSGIGRGRSCTLAEIARDHGISRERVRQIAQRGIAKLRRSKLLRDLWDEM